MGDFPNLLLGGGSPAGLLSTADNDPGTIGEMMAVAKVNLASVGAYPTANRALFYPVTVQRPVIAQQMGVIVGTQSGNIDVGIYDENGVRLVSSGSTVVGAAGVQTFDITDTPLAPGVYYLAMAVSNTTATFNRSAGLIVGALRGAGVRQMDTALPLPSTATFATIASNFVPLLVASTISVL